MAEPVQETPSPELDPATPIHVKEPVVEPVIEENPNPPEVKEEQPANQGGDPDGDTPPEKDVEDPAPKPVDLSNENQQVADMVVEAGLDAKELRTAITENGGVLPLVAMKALVEKHGEAVAGLMASKLNGMYTNEQAAIADANTSLYAKFETEFEGIAEGTGKEAFDSAAAWARENMPKEDRAGLQELLRSPNKYVRDLGLNKLATAYKGADTYTQDATLELGDTTVTTNVTSLSKQAYQIELNALMGKGYSYESPEVRQLQNRRTAAMKKGR